MAYFAPYIDSTGLHLPTYADRMEDLESAYRSIFGQEAELSPAVPDYQLLSVFVRGLDDVSTLVLQDFNARNPQYAQGAALDLLLPLYGLSRRGATRSEVGLTLSGSAGAVIPAGSTVIDTGGVLWDLEEAVTLDSSGAGAGVGVCRTPGAVYAQANTVTGIVTPVTGWTAVTNEQGSSIGLNEETDAEVRARIAGALAGKSVTLEDSIRAAVAAVPNVRTFLLVVNESDSANAQGIPAHTIAVLVNGGDLQTLAEAIWKSKAPGIGTWGSTTKTVYDEAGNPHEVKLSRPSTLGIRLAISLQSLTGFDLTAVSGLINVPQLYGVCYEAVGPEWRNTFVITGMTATSGGTSSTGLFPVSWNQLVSFNASQITITVS